MVSYQLLRELSLSKIPIFSLIHGFHLINTMSDRLSEQTQLGSTSNDNVDPAQERKDLELNPVPSVHLVNDVVYSFAWKEMNVTVKDRVT